MSEDLFATLSEFDAMGQDIPPRMQRMILALFQGWARAGALAVALREGECDLASIRHDIETARAAQAEHDAHERAEHVLVVTQRSAEVEALERTVRDLVSRRDALAAEVEALERRRVDAAASLDRHKESLETASRALA